MTPPYDITTDIINLMTSIMEKVGQINAHHLDRPLPALRKKNRVKTIQASLEIEGNTLSIDHITAIINNKKIAGPKNDILEVMNAIEVYEKLDQLQPDSLKTFLAAHHILMKNLLDSAGQLRSKSVGIIRGDEISHVAPPAKNLPSLMQELFEYLKSSKDHVLIKSCVVHYEIEFIHPFLDGNGRIGRLWQSLILMKAYPLFEFLPFETIIKERQSEYYKALERSDKEGKSTSFIEFMLKALNDSLDELLESQSDMNRPEKRLDYFISRFDHQEFTRKDYLVIFKNISTATASRDLKFGVDQGLLTKSGTKRLATYKIKE